METKPHANLYLLTSKVTPSDPNYSGLAYLVRLTRVEFYQMGVKRNICWRTAVRFIPSMLIKHIRHSWAKLASWVWKEINDSQLESFASYFHFHQAEWDWKNSTERTQRSSLRSRKWRFLWRRNTGTCTNDVSKKNEILSPSPAP